ncbi:Nse4 C-terminal-domain-containing protein [Armillaria borealis]|uniref:Non-structural maintenance of chromosomes element 4 n=1 Tax=Armillaria borealis TaxID=47425 RepID=A0AA39K398_9AGAR|nr:Nse4 C-terminal-domain-containing protein [Armillaria borealis]
MTDSDQESLVYDPDQDVEDVRALRKDYRSLAKKMEEYRSNIAGVSIKQMEQDVGKADILFKKVRGPKEATLDSALLLLASNLGTQKARSIKCGSVSFDADELVTRIVTFMGSRRFEDVVDRDSDFSEEEENPDATRALDWQRIGRKALAKSRRVPAPSFMLGPLSIEVKKRPAKCARLEKNKADQRRPQELKEADIARSDNETTKNVILLSALLERTGRVNLFRFVVNPHDFAQTVENIFHLSFLIREGKACLEFQDGEPMIYPCSEEDASERDENAPRRQLIMEFDHATWERAIDVFNIEDALIFDRRPGREKSGVVKWLP